MKSRVHPTYKTQYHVQNWAAYDRALVCRGDITIWLSPAAIAAWEPDGTGTRGAQRKYSDLAIESALTLRLLFHLPLRPVELPRLGSRGDGPSTGDHRSGTGARRPEQGGDGLRSLGPVRAAVHLSDFRGRTNRSGYHHYIGPGAGCFAHVVGGEVGETGAAYVRRHRCALPHVQVAPVPHDHPGVRLAQGTYEAAAAR